MTPEPNPDKLPLIPAPPEVEQPEDLTAYARFITHDKYRNTIAVHDTQLIQQFCKSAPYMEELHRKQLVDLDHRMLKHRNNNISRTAHQQVAAIITRYLPRIKEQNSPLADLLEPALAEAKKIETLSAQLTDEVQRNRTMGNVRFVKELVPGKKT